MPIKVCRPDDIRHWRREVRQQAQRTLQELFNRDPDDIEVFYRIRFDHCGYHPLDGTRLNFAEQMNMTSHAMVVFAAAETLMNMEWFGDCGGLLLRPTWESGWDIQSINQDVAHAEAFAATTRSNNGKFLEDIRNLKDSPARHRCLFFYAPSHEDRADRQEDLERVHGGGEIEIWALNREQIM